MAICATCGRPVDAAKPRQRPCPSCTWRAAVRVSQAASPDETAATDSTIELTPGDAEGLIAAEVDPVAMTILLRDFASAAGQSFAFDRARRVHGALVRGNPRPYHAEMNRMIGQFIDRLEQTWMR